MAVSYAFDPYEDTAENLAPQVENNREVPNFKARSGTWTYAFELMLPDGTTQILSESNRTLMVKPASTMKIFTGWFAYKQGFRTDKYLGQMLKESVNAMATSTFTAMGGAKKLKAFYGEQGLVLNSTNHIQADGSGLSYDNKSTCASQVELLKIIYRDPAYNNFKVLMARPGEEGTLKTRLSALEGKLFAKTGTLKRTASLSGFVETKAGTVVFCILTDYLPAASANYRPRIDAMVLKNIETLGY
ncbi:MAG: D-alanyl-D-alanine carboxypeptidase [Bdellovibrionota bacterium]